MSAAQLCQEPQAAVHPVARLGATPTRHLDLLLELERRGARASGGAPAAEGATTDPRAELVDAFVARSGAEGALPDQADVDPAHMGRDVMSTAFTATCPGAQVLRACFPNFPRFRLLPGGPVWAVTKLLDYTTAASAQGKTYRGKNTVVLQLALATPPTTTGGAPPPRAAVLKLTGLPVAEGAAMAGADPREAPSMEASDALWVHADAVYAYYAARRVAVAAVPTDEPADLVGQQRAELDASLRSSLAESRLGAVARVNP
jgi:hypothetical protein